MKLDITEQELVKRPGWEKTQESVYEYISENHRILVYPSVEGYALSYYMIHCFPGEVWRQSQTNLLAAVETAEQQCGIWKKERLERDISDLTAALNSKKSYTYGKIQIMKNELRECQRILSSM